MDCDFTENVHQGKKYICTKCQYETNFLAKRNCGKPIIQKEPNLLRKIGNFTMAFAQHLSKGFPTVSQQELDNRLKICQECPLFKQKGLVGGVCTHNSCGCNVQDEISFLNKLAWADQKCPLDKWEEVEKGV